MNREMELYTISTELRQLLDGAVDPDTGEINPLFDTMIEAMAIHKDRLVLDCAAYCKEREAAAAGVQAEIKRLQDRAARAQASADRARGVVERYCEDGRKMESAVVSIGWRKCPPRTVVDNAEALPESCWRVKREVSLTAVKEALKAGDEVVAKAAHLEERKVVVIR